MLAKQSLHDMGILIIDSGSSDEWRAMADKINAEVVSISPAQFNHGKTREMGARRHDEADVYVFLTQDAVPADEHTIERLVAVFDDDTVGCAYGRQLPYDGASIFARMAREFNYGEKSYIRSFSDKSKYGIKTAFLSDSFAAYRRAALDDVGGFPRTNFAEDMYVAAKMLMNGWRVAYVADARVYHSHDYSLAEEFHRYVENGKFHKQNEWIQREFGKAEGEGKKFVMKEIKYLSKTNPLCIPQMILRDAAKYFGYVWGQIK